MPTFGRTSDSIAVNPTIDRYTATAAQTVFTLSAAPAAMILVWVNGILQEPTTHYTISGRTLTLGTACTVGDKVAVEYGTDRTTLVAKSIDLLEAFDLAYPGVGASYEMDGTGTSIPTGLVGTDLGTSTFVQDCGALVMAVPSAAGDNVRMVGAAVSGSTWTAVMKFSAMLPRPGTCNYGMYLRDSTSGKLITFARNQADGNLNVYKWTSPTVFSTVGVTVSYGVTADRVPDYWRIKKNNATSYDFAVSYDGAAWRTSAVAYDVSAWLTTPDEVGFHTNPTSAIDQVACHWLRWRA